MTSVYGFALLSGFLLWFGHSYEGSLYIVQLGTPGGKLLYYKW